MPKLGINIDHIATIREARHTVEPDPVWAASICELAGCHSIVIHLRQDRRHINDRDLEILRKTVRTRLNLEMSILSEIVSIACKVRPDQATLVPEKRAELTTEGGLDVCRYKGKVATALRRLKRRGILVSLFVDPNQKQIAASKDLNIDSVEIHTGLYANAKNEIKRRSELDRIREAVQQATELGLRVNAGHGLTYQNVRDVALISSVEELNIGHSIISRSVLVGLDRAVREMLTLIS
ncbi:MAG: pyridoxine 5'-phosphate synthase [Candidatus Omnitrophica bacterium]|nr:pyridoxine 5'-phosphate synthase [Candidatus Omnitrophota bacterium]